MRISVIYLHVLGKSQDFAKDPSYYRPFSERFASTYEKFKPTIPSELRVVFCGSEPTDKDKELYAGLGAVFDTYLGTGWDLGAHQTIASKLDHDMVLCLATPAYLWLEGWLELTAEAFDMNGDGLYGPMASYELAPHIRTSAFAFSPATIRTYPHEINSRETCFHFESGFTSTGIPHQSCSWSFSNWMAEQGKPVLMVNAEGCYVRDEWRKPDNIFRRGDQSNCLIRDRHWDIYQAASEAEKRTLEHLANGIPWQAL